MLRTGKGLMLSLLVLAPWAQAADKNADQVLDLVKRQAEAQRSFDVSTLKAVTAESYIEVSPKGEVDPREKMLGFYGPENKGASPQVSVDEPTVRIFGDTAVAISKLTFTGQSQGQTRTFAMRVTHVAQKAGGSWKLVSAHYSNIR